MYFLSNSKISFTVNVRILPSLQHKKAFSKSAVDVFVLNSDAVRLVQAHVSLEFKHLAFLNFEYPWNYNV